MAFDIREILRSKQAFRQRLAAQSVAEKLRLLDELRRRALAIAQLPRVPLAIVEDRCALPFFLKLRNPGYKQGDRAACRVLHLPPAEDEDARHLQQELQTLRDERIAHENRMRSALFAQGIRCEYVCQDFVAQPEHHPVTSPRKAFPRWS